MINAPRAHLAEHGIIVAKGVGNLQRLAEAVADEASVLPELVREMGGLCLERIEQTSAQIACLERRTAAAARESELVRRLLGMPGIGPICALTVEICAPAMESFRCGRDFSAWLGRVRHLHSTGGRQKLGRTSKMGQRDIRRLLIVGAMSVVHWKGRGGGRLGPWLARMLVAIAVANKMVRMIWAMLVRGEDYRDPTRAVC